MVSNWHRQGSRPVAYATPKRTRRLSPSKKLEVFKQIKLLLDAGVRQQDICYKLDVGDGTVLRVKQKIKRGEL